MMNDDVAVSSQIDTYVRGESAQTDSTSKAVFARSGYAAMQIRPGKPPAAPDKPKTKYKIAHIHEQGNDMIIVPVDAEFENRSKNEMRRVLDGLQEAALSAGLAGTVVPVWDHGGGMMAFLTPRPWLPFFQSIDMNFVWRNVNRELTL